MDEEVIESKQGEAEFYIGTVKAWSNAAGVEVQLDGQDSPMEKRYKMMLMCRPLKVGSRVVVMKHSGTYIVLGEISKPNSYKNIATLASDATLATTVSKVNEVINWMRTQGMVW